MPAGHDRERGEPEIGDDRQLEQSPSRALPAGREQPCEYRQHEVELLLDRQRPVVLHRRRCTEQRAVRLTREVEAPVRHVDQCAEQVDASCGAVRDEPAPVDDRHGGEAEECRRQQAPGAPRPEPAEGDRAGAVAFAQQQRGDQEARQREEHRHAEKAALGPPEPAVEQQHRADGEGAQPVERRQVRAVTRSVLGSRVVSGRVVGGRVVDSVGAEAGADADRPVTHRPQPPTSRSDRRRAACAPGSRGTPTPRRSRRSPRSPAGRG